jgi:DNA-binding winged helix-turn-helix (wHTH) protein/tetratricopeptide (TPR) repeat protein
LAYSIHAMDRSKPTRLRFGPFEADLESSELFDSGQLVHLQSKPFQFLAVLLQHPGEIVTREQMSHVLWPDIYVQINQGLNAAARKVRIALDDHVESPRYFETLGSHGYRFIHDIEVLAWKEDAETPTEPPLRLAVLPFRVEGSDPISGEGLAAEISTLLGRAHPRLKVIAASSTLTFGDPEETDAAANRLGASLVMTGTVQRLRSKIHLTARLLDIPRERQIWEWSAERNNSEIFEALHEMTNQVVRAIPSGNLPENTAVPRTQSTEFSNYLGFLKAQQDWYERKNTRILSALSEFEKVSKRDPRFAPALAGIARTQILLAKHEVVVPRPAYQAALECGLAALELAPDLPEALTATAWARLSLEHDWVSATRLYERALQLNPSYAFGYVGYGTLLLSRGRVDEAVNAMQLAHQLDPLSPFTSTSLATAYYYARRFDEALRQARESLALDPDWNAAHALVGMCTLAQRRFKDALDHFEAATENSQHDPVMEAHLAHAYAQVGNINGAQPILARLENRNGSVPKPAFHIALIRLVLGDVNGAVRWLDQACRERFERTLFLGIDPRLDVLRGTKHFEEMCKQVREPDPRRRSQEQAHTRGGAA